MDAYRVKHIALKHGRLAGCGLTVVTLIDLIG
jgi:hypothetical protein